MMWITAVFLSAFICTSLSRSTPIANKKRQNYALPEGAELLVGEIRSTFTCFADGYYADVDNNCQIFHVCYTSDTPEGKREQFQYSFLCGNQTMFNQLTFTCTYPEDAVPCVNAQDFYYLNANVEAADPEVHFLDDQDIQRAAPLIKQDYLARRIEKPPSSYYQPQRRRFNFGDKE